MHVYFRSITQLGQVMELQETVAQPNKADLSNIFLQTYLLAEDDLIHMQTSYYIIACIRKGRQGK